MCEQSKETVMGKYGKNTGNRKDSLAGIETILLVESSPSLRNAMVEGLERFGYQVLAVANGREALALIEEEQPLIHLLVTALNLPWINGRKLAQTLRSKFPTLPSILLLESAAPDLIRQIHPILGMQYLGVTFSMSDLAQAARVALDLPEN